MLYTLDKLMKGNAIKLPNQPRKIKCIQYTYTFIHKAETKKVFCFVFPERV